MTPFRSYIVTAALAANVAILGTVQLKGGVITYMVVSTLTEYTDRAHKPTLCINARIWNAKNLAEHYKPLDCTMTSSDTCRDF